MELEEMRNKWQEMSKKMEKQQLLTDKLIMEMTKEKYNNKLKLISIPETIGTIICFGAALYILMNLSKLNSWYLMVSGIFAVIYLILLPIKSLSSINKMKSINISNKNIEETLSDFVKGKKRFWLIQRVAFYLNFIFIIAILPIAGKLMRNKDLFLESKLWYIYIPILLIFMVLFSKWGFKHYKNATDSAEKILKDLEIS